MLASESAGDEKGREIGHRNSFRLLMEKGFSWSGKEPNVLFTNDGKGHFDEVGNVLGVALKLDSRGAAAGDLDGDGDLDLVVYNRNNPTVRIYRNDAPVQGNALLVDLVGKGKNTRAIGAQVIASAGGIRQLRQVEVGSGFLSQSPTTLHFGIGGARAVDSLEIHWPSGAVQEVSDLPVDHRVRITEGSDEVTRTPLRARNYNRGASGAGPTHGGLSARMPEGLHMRRLEGEGDVSLDALGKGTMVVNFWAEWCTACKAEMPLLLDLANRFKGKVTFTGVCLDDPATPDAALAYLRGAGLEKAFTHGWGSPELMAPFTSLAEVPPGTVPITAVVHEGVVRWVHAGKLEDDGLLGGLLEKLTAE